MKIFKFLSVYFKFIIQKKYYWKHYERKVWKIDMFSGEYGNGFEVINTKTNKVVIRKGRYTNNLDSTFCTWKDLNINFLKNA